MTTTIATPTPSAAAPNGTAAAAAQKSALDASGFLNILMAEMRNQDPTQPAAPTQWAAQYAQMTGVQQSVLTNQKLDSLLTEQALSQAVGAVGRSVQSADGTIAGKIVSVQLNAGTLKTTKIGSARVLPGQQLTGLMAYLAVRAYQFSFQGCRGAYPWIQPGVIQFGSRVMEYLAIHELQQPEFRSGLFQLLDDLRVLVGPDAVT